MHYIYIQYEQLILHRTTPLAATTAPATHVNIAGCLKRLCCHCDICKQTNRPNSVSLDNPGVNVDLYTPM